MTLINAENSKGDYRTVKDCRGATEWPETGLIKGMLFMATTGEQQEEEWPRPGGCDGN